MIFTNNLTLVLSFEALLFFYFIALLCYALFFSSFHSFGYSNVILVLFNVFAFLFYLLWVNSSIIFSNSYLIYYENFFHFVFSDILRIIVLFLSFLFLFFTKDFTKQLQIFNYEYLLFLMLSVIGLLVLALSNDIVSLYISLEIQTLACYTLAVYFFTSQYSVESGIKYFTVGSIASSFLLLGFVILYFSFGFFTIDSIFLLNSFTSYFVISYLFVLLALLLKLGVFPFHQWLCDVYEGCLTSVTLFFSTIPKVVLLGLFVRLSYTLFLEFSYSSYTILLLFSLFSIAFPSIIALYQRRVKRLLAYSSISHVGFILLAISLLSLDSLKSSFLYLLIYLTLSFSFFLLLLITSTKSLFFKYLLNWVSVAVVGFSTSFGFLIVLLATAGIPPLSGFLSKLSVLQVLVFEGFYFVALAIVLFSCISCFYYLRLTKIIALTSKPNTTVWFSINSRNTSMLLGFLFILTTCLAFRPDIFNSLAIVLSLFFV